MLTGMDCFSTDVVALRHQGALTDTVKTLPELLRENGYISTCIGFGGNPSSRGFDSYMEFAGWGSWAEGRSHKAENLNAVAIPELKRLAAQDKPFCLFMRHMDPHAPYLPPYPFERIFYDKDEYDPENKSLDPVYKFKPFCDFFAAWFPPMCTDKDYIIAQYDGAIAYMDACINNILATLRDLGIEDETAVVFTSDHGETHYDHQCWFDHHGLYDCTLTVPLAVRFPAKVPKGFKSDVYCQLKDIVPTLVDILDLETDIEFDGRNLVPLFSGGEIKQEPEIYITECTWERKHGWRTPEWKLIVALEPDFHYREMVELYNLVKDPSENLNVAEENPEVVAMLTARMEKHIANREKAVGRKNPMYTNLNWHGAGCGPFTSHDQAYNTLYIGDPVSAQKLQAMLAEMNKG